MQLKPGMPETVSNKKSQLSSFCSTLGNEAFFQVPLRNEY